ncbi:MAG: hypothetical protein GX547_13240 [Phycisphaerae bacterium]|nr:hypothetical protein [Phycisphaerae bacterium]
MIVPLPGFLAHLDWNPLWQAMGGAGAALLAWVPFVNPVKLPAGARLWMYLPLTLCIAVVYRATRARSLEKLPRGTLLTFVNITVGMIAIAVAFYVVSRAALYLRPVSA